MQSKNLGPEVAIFVILLSKWQNRYQNTSYINHLLQAAKTAIERNLSHHTRTGT